MKFKLGLTALAVFGIFMQSRAAGIDLSALPHATRDGVIETPGIVYESLIGYRPLELTLYQPENASGPLPIVLYFHGGGWGLNPFKPVTGTPPQANPPLGDTDETFVTLARRGYLVANVTYRLSHEAKFPAQIQDIKKAVKFLRAHAADIGGDPNHVIAWGSSAGGYLAVLLGTSCGVQALEPVSAVPGNGPPGVSTLPDETAAASDCVDGVVDWYGPIDFLKLDAQTAQNHLPGGMGVAHDSAAGPESTLLGCALSSCSPDLLKAANPLTYVSAQTPPFLIIQGTADSAVPYQQSVELADALKAAGVKVTLHLVPNSNHMFMGIPRAEQLSLMNESFAWMDGLAGK